MANPEATLRDTNKPKRGRPSGFDKERARQILRDLVTANMHALVQSQIANAQGVKFLVSRDTKTGKFTVLTEQAAKLILEGDPKGERREIIEVWDKVPNVQAFSTLMDRTIDKPTEHVEMQHSGQVNITERLAAGRKRVADARRK